MIYQVPKILKVDSKGKPSDGAINMKYICSYCEFPFKLVVRKSGSSKKTYASTQVRCPACGNFLKTWR